MLIFVLILGKRRDILQLLVSCEIINHMRPQIRCGSFYVAALNCLRYGVLKICQYTCKGTVTTTIEELLYIKAVTDDL